MELEIGRVVISASGRDKGYFLVVTDVTSEGVFVCDGKERPLERPKRKNPRHLRATRYVLSGAETATNRSLKRALREISNPGKREVK